MTTTTAIFTLMLAGAGAAPTFAQTGAAPAFAQGATAGKPAAPVAPIAPNAPVAPIAPIAPIKPFLVDLHEFELDFDVDFDFSLAEHAKELKEHAKAFEQHFKGKDFELQIKGAKQEAIMQLDRQMAELSRQLPVPPVARVPRRDPREEQREQERAKQPRKRFPEGWVESTEPFTRSFKVGRNSALMVANISGNIQVSPGGNDQIEVQAKKHAWGQDAEQAKQRLGDATIEAYATGNRVELRVEHAARKDGRGVDVEFDVKVPADASVELRTVSGDLRVTNVKGEIRVQGVSGNLALEGTPRLVMVKAVSGDITLMNAGADAQLSVSTVSGDTLAQTLTARSLDLNTVSGDVRINGWSGDRALIRALSGNVDLDASLAKAGRYEIESHSGDVHLSLPEQPGFELESHTFSGRIRVDFPIKSEGPIRDGDRGPRSVRGTYGEGGSSLRVQTFSGNLTITRK